MDFSQRLKRLMDERHLTNYELAKKLDIHPTTVANWLGGSEPRKKTMAMLYENADQICSEVKDNCVVQRFEFELEK